MKVSEPVEALNREQHCGTCFRFWQANKNGWGHCRLYPEHFLLSGLFPCRFNPSRWVHKVSGAVTSGGGD